MNYDPIDQQRILLYEAHSSWIYPLCGWKWTRGLASTYLAWKVNRKYQRYVASLNARAFLELKGKL